MSSSKAEIEEDIKELKLFQASVSRQRNINLFETELNHCEKILQCISLLDEDSARFGTKEQQSVSHQQSGAESAVTAPTKFSTLLVTESDADICASHNTVKTVNQMVNNATTAYDPVIRTETIINYSWDQTPKLVKLYVRVDGVRKSDKVACSFTGNTCTLIVSEVNNKNYSLVINNLARPIIVRKSCHETRTDEVIVKMFKAETNEQWLAVTAVEAAMLQKKTAHKVEAKAGNSAKSSNDVDQDTSPNAALLTKILVENVRWTSSTKNEHRLSRTVAAAFAPNPKYNHALVVLDHEMAIKAIEIIETRPFKIMVFIMMPELAVHEKYVGMMEDLILNLTTLRSCLQLRCYDGFWMRGCTETLIRDDASWINALLQSTKRGVCTLVGMYANLEAATIRKLPFIVSLGLAVARRDQYDAIQELQVHECFELSIAHNLDVSGYPPLKPWTKFVILHFYGLRDCDQEWMIRTIRTLTNDRMCHIVLPGSELTANGCAHLGSRMSAINARTIQIDSPYITDKKDQILVARPFYSNGTTVMWGLERIYYWYEGLLVQD